MEDDTFLRSTLPAVRRSGSDKAEEESMKDIAELMLLCALWGRCSALMESKGNLDDHCFNDSDVLCDFDRFVSNCMPYHPRPPKEWILDWWGASERLQKKNLMENFKGEWALTSFLKRVDNGEWEKP